MIKTFVSAKMDVIALNNFLVPYLVQE